MRIFFLIKYYIFDSFHIIKHYGDNKKCNNNPQDTSCQIYKAQIVIQNIVYLKLENENIKICTKKII